MNHSPRHGNELLFEEDLLCLLFSVAFFFLKKNFSFHGMGFRVRVRVPRSFIYILSFAWADHDGD